jgi:hypothetical protein
MAITFVLQSRGSNHAVYLATSTGTTAAFDTGTIQPTGAGDADVALEDAGVPPAGAHWNAGLLKQVMDLANIDSAAKARRQLLDMGGVGSVTALDGILNVAGKRCRAWIQPLLPTGGQVHKNWSLDADDSGAGNRGEYNVACTAAGASAALIYIEALGTPQNF